LGFAGQKATVSGPAGLGVDRRNGVADGMDGVNDADDGVRNGPGAGDQKARRGSAQPILILGDGAFVSAILHSLVICL